MKPCIIIFLLFLWAFATDSLAQNRKTKIKTGNNVTSPDSVTIPLSQTALFIPPKKNLLTTHIDFAAGAGRVAHDDRAGLSFAATVKGLYALTGVLYLNMGFGVTRLNSIIHTGGRFDGGKNKTMMLNFPIGLAFSIGDDRAQIINNIDFLPVYYVDYPEVKRERIFTCGIGIDLGFHIRIKQRLHLGMMGKLQLFNPYDRDEPQSFPRYGFVGGGLLLRYD